MASMISEHESFQGVDGKPIVNGYIYVGAAGQDPKLNPIVIYSDRDLTTPIANPQRTDSYGRAQNKIWVPARYSLKVEDSNGAQKLQDLQRGELADSPTINLINVQGINDVTAEAVPPVSAYVDKAVYVLTVVSTNTGAVTLDFGAGPAPVEKNNGDALVTGDWPAGSIQRVTYNAFSSRFDTLTFSTVEINNEITQIKADLLKTLPIGWPFPIFSHITGVTVPSNAGDEKYILLTAGESGVGEYNEGLLTSESVSGTSPNIAATAVISHAESPMDGQTVPLINTSRPFIRPGSSGAEQSSQNLSHTHTYPFRQTVLEAATIYPGSGSGAANTGTTASSGGDESRPRNIGATYYMRIA
tara:strand:+ start:35210 stop:36283 length:1074 start_codon:yes stop_codon:yes gene_type:complete